MKIWMLSAFCLLISPLSLAGVSPGDTPPPLVGRTVGGDIVNLEDYHGKVVALTFWATWCPYCLKEMPILASIQKKLGMEQFRVIAVNYKEERKIFRSVVAKTKKHKLVMAHDKNGKYGKPFEVSGLPLLYLIDHEGKVAYKHTGYGERTLKKIIKEIALLVDARNKALGLEVHLESE